MKKLEVNSRVEVEKDGIAYKSKIQSLNSDSIYIDIPLYNKEFLLLHSGEVITVVSYGENGIVFEMECKVLGRAVDGKVRVYKLEKPTKIRKVQRRNFVRVTITNFIKCVSGSELFDCILLDLSGGGMRVKTRKKLKLNDKFLAIISHNTTVAEVDCRVVRVEDKEDNYEVLGIEFTDIRNREREAVIKIVFEIMRKQMELV
ncbi:MAG: flagellar brake protein [Sarcina sp.]